MHNFLFKFLERIHIIEILFNSRKLLRNQNEIIKAHIFNSSICDSQWLKHKSFSPGGWAADYAFLYTLYRIINGTRPSSILEFGLGQTSKMIHQYANYFNAKAITYEHDQKWIDFFNKGKDGDYNVYTKIIELEDTIYKGFQTLTYKNIKNELDGEKYDLVVVDAPFGTDHYSRPQIIDIAKYNLADSFCIIMDDCERTGEKETINEVKKVLEEKDIKYNFCVYSSTKDHALICSDDLSFLTTL